MHGKTDGERGFQALQKVADNDAAIRKKKERNLEDTMPHAAAHAKKFHGENETFYPLGKKKK